MKAFALFILIGCLSHKLFAQDFAVSFTPPTNSAPIKAYELLATDATNGWKGVEWVASTTNKICFKSWNLPKNPCLLAVRSVGMTNSSEPSISINFDTRDWTNKPVLPNPVLPPTFLWVEKL